MAMRDGLTEAGVRALPYWSAVRNAAVNHTTTVQLWDAIRAVQARYGGDGPGPSVRGISELRGIAGGIVRHSDRLFGLAPGKTLRGTVIGRAPWARPMRQQAANPIYQVQFRHTFKEGEDVQQTWRTITFSGKLPRTAGEFQDQIDADIENMSDAYGVEHLDAGQFQIMSV